MFVCSLARMGRGGLMPAKSLHAEERIPVSAARTAEPDRELFCTHYDHCLDTTIERNWPGFSCGCCPLRGLVSVRPSPAQEDVAESSPALRRLLWGLVPGFSGAVGLRRIDTD